MDVRKVTPISMVYKAIDQKRPPTPAPVLKQKPASGFAEVLEEARKKLV